MSVSTVVALFALVGSNLAWVDITYVRNSTFGQFQKSTEFDYALNIKAEIRRLRQGPQDRHTAEDIAKLIDKLCQLTPEDRECRP